MSIPAIILAAGASRRLGRPKQLVHIAGETLLARTLRMARGAGAGPIFVVLGARGEEIAAGMDLSTAHPVVNPDWEKGIATSIQAGIHALRQLHPEVSGALLLVCDQPRLTAEHLLRLIEVFEQASELAIVASQYADTAGIPAIFPASQFAKLNALTGDTGARSLLRNPDCSVVTVLFEGGEVDIDTPSDIDSSFH
jgi:molybdenum cofactor cytidylyltransferase